MAFVNLLLDSHSNLKQARNPVDFLHSKLRERAQFANYTEQNDEKPHRCFGLPQICATDVDVAKRGGVPQPATAATTTTDDDSLAVKKLLPLVKNETSIGRDAEKEQLLWLLLFPDQRRTQLSVVSVVGNGGMGKTALVRQIYGDRRVEDHFDLKAWVRIDGQQQGNHQLVDIARKLMKSATGMLCSFNTLLEMHEIVIDTLLSHRSLIVLDDFDFMEPRVWRDMKDIWFRFVGVGSKVVITTRKREIGIVGSVPIYVGKLSPADSFSLYSSLADRLVPADRWLAGRCEGVPLSLKLLGSLMRFDQSRLRSSYLMDIINSDASSFEDTSFVLLIGVLSLPDDLFSCFAFCGIFPYGYVLEKEKLIKMWIANDVVKPSTTGMSLEDTGEACFHQLLCRSFFTDITCDEYGEVLKARMPLAVHESARTIARVVSRHKVAYAFGVDVNCLGISIEMPLIDEEESQTSYNPIHLQTLVSFPPKNPNGQHIETRSFVELKRLRSLDLSRCGIRKLSKHVCTLRKLMYLNLSHNLLNKLPKSFTNLTQLQTLDLSRCYYLKFLPKKISNLSKLRHLDLSHCNSLSDMPFGVGHLHSLITMPLYVLGERGSKCATLGELRMLKNLQGLLHIRNLEHVEVDEARAADLKQKKLHHLRLSWSHKPYKCSGKALLECLEPNPQLRVLELAGYGDREFPPWMPNLCFLSKLLINDCGFDTIPKLGQLQFLKELELEKLINISSIGQEFYGNGGGNGDVFPSLEKLKLHGMPNLSIWSSHYTSSSNKAIFSKLKKLSIQDCPELRTLPSLPSVTELVVWRSHAEILPWLTRTRSLSSIVANDMSVKESLKSSSAMNTVKKLILVRSTDLDVLESSHINNFASLQHLRILHCLELKRVKLPRLGSLEKLDVVDCQNLERVDINTEEFTLTELMVEDCPRITTINITTFSLRKLVVRNCPKFSGISPEKIRDLRERGLEFLFIT